MGIENMTNKKNPAGGSPASNFKKPQSEAPKTHFDDVREKEQRHYQLGYN